MTFYKAALSNILGNLLGRNPFVCVTTAFICGIVAFRFLPISLSNNSVMVLCILTATILIIASHILTRIHLVCLLSWFSIAGYSISSLQQEQYQKLPSGDYFVAEICGNLEEKPKTYKTTVLSHSTKKCKTIIYIQKDSSSATLQHGDILIIKNTCKRIENTETSTFNYKRFLANQYIYSQAYVKSGQWNKIGHRNSFVSLCMKIRKWALLTLSKNGLSNENQRIIAALAFGDKSLLDTETKQEFQTAGAMHILAVSGLHVGIVNGLLFFIFGFIRTRKLLWLKIIACISGIWFYACITGMSPSVQRAACMCTMISLSLLLQRHISTYNSLAVAAFISLFLSPNDLFSVSFQLSYVAVLSIVYFGSIIQNMLHLETPIGSYLWGIVAVSVAVQIGTMPLTLYYFGMIPTYSLLTNIVVIPVSFIILLTTIVALATSWIHIISHGAIIVLDFAVAYLQDAISDINSFPHPQTEISISLPQSICFYILIGVSVAGIEILQKRKEQKVYMIV